MNGTIIVAGGRDFTDIQLMHRAVVELCEKKIIKPTVELICGMARGADMTAYNLWEQTYGNVIHKYPADWDKFGKQAGFMRNRKMGNAGDVLLAFWDGESKGTQHMIEYMRDVCKKPTYIVRY